MRHLATALRRHYTIVGKTLVFSGGRTLQEVALSMWQELEFSQVDASVLSRVVHGKRLFTFRQIDAFCRVLSLSPSQRETLYHNLIKDLCEKHDVAFPGLFVSTPDIIAMVNQLIKNAHALQENNKFSEAARAKRQVFQFFGHIIAQASRSHRAPGRPAQNSSPLPRRAWCA